jgi:hypothetical protein
LTICSSHSITSLFHYKTSNNNNAMHFSESDFPREFNTKKTYQNQTKKVFHGMLIQIITVLKFVWGLDFFNESETSVRVVHWTNQLILSENSCIDLTFFWGVQARGWLVCLLVFILQMKDCQFPISTDIVSR